MFALQGDIENEVVFIYRKEKNTAIESAGVTGRPLCKNACCIWPAIGLFIV